jgi:hypothetical protein
MGMPTCYRLKIPYNNLPAGTLVYSYKYWDYGLAKDDTYLTGVEHISVTLKPDGTYPSFTIPIQDLHTLS